MTFNFVMPIIFNPSAKIIRDPEQRYAKAGFPTKFVESLCCSTPVICNLTSDLERYVIDGVNAIVINDINETSLSEKLKELILLPPDQLNQMKNTARNTAIKEFDYHHYSNALISFIAEQRK